MKQIGLGIIGLGAQGRLSLRNALLIKQAEVSAVADVSERSLSYAKRMGVKNVYLSYDELLRNDDVDAVVINLPNFLHLEGAVKAAEAGKHILMEKPLARDVEEAEKIVKVVKKNGVKLMMGYDLRFNPLYRRIHDEIDDGLFGSVKIAEATNVSSGPFSSRGDNSGPVPVPAWWFEKNLTGGGALLDLGSHMIDLLIWYFGEVDYTASVLEHMFKTDLEDAATCILHFKQGTTATVKVGWFSKGICQSIQICGTSKNEVVCVYPQSTLRTAWKGVKRKIGLSSSPYYLKLEHFVTSLQKDEQPQPSGEDGLYDQKVIAQAYENVLKSN